MGSTHSVIESFETFVFKHFDGKVPALGKFEKIDEDMLKEISEYPHRVAELFEKYKIHQIIDFTNFRRVLFPTATVPTCAVFLSNEAPSSNYTTHVVVRRTNPSKERLYFEIDSYDKQENADMTKKLTNVKANNITFVNIEENNQC